MNLSFRALTTRCEIGEGRERERENILKKEKKEKDRRERGNVFNERNKLKDENR